MTFIRNRSDVSDWLIHFVRDRDPEDDSPDGYDEDEPGGLEPDAPAYSVLSAIIEVGALRPGCSLRNGRTTIYGGRPVVCFTEVPVYNFVRYASERNRPNRCAQFGICLPRREVFAAGARPAIYGLTGSTPPLIKDTTLSRVIEPAILPLSEQYRYVAYDPTSLRPLDWTHEREWRWTASDTPEHRICCEGWNGIGEYPGLPLFRASEDGGFFSRIGFLVRTRMQAQELAKTLLALADAGGNDWGEEYSTELLRSAFVVPLEDVEARKIERIEDLANDMRIVATRTKATAELVQRVRELAVEAGRVGSVAAATYIANASKNSGGHVQDMCGGAIVVTYDATSEVTDALLQAGVACSVAGQCYELQLDIQVHEQAISAHEAGAEAAASFLTAALQQHFGVHSQLD